jgi:ParB-like chromosome segregation protein Spo0J
LQQFHINKEYQDLIPPLTIQEFNELRESIRNNGQRLRITVSDRTGQLVIVDGHHRYKACKERGIEPKYIIRHFEDEAEEIAFIDDCNRKRRHLNIFQRGVIALRTKYKLEEIARRGFHLS